MRFSGKVALVANPAAKSGKGREAAYRAHELLEAALGTGSCELVLTEAPGHAVDVAANLETSFQAVVALGGDGVIHEVANGIMRRRADERPVLGVVPVGSGNDYAATLGMSCNVERAVRQILGGRACSVDVGRVNGLYFVETLSFGLDAAIALDTVERRKKSGKSGTALYLESGIDQLFHHLNTLRYKATLHGCPAFDEADGRVGAAEGSRRIEGESFLFAVQLGPTYGGRFKVCPDAQLDDGLFDICLAHPPLGVLRATGIFLLAKNGHHTTFKQLEFHRANGLDVEFDAEPPAQMDGEKLTGTRFAIDCVPAAFSVVVAKR